MSTEKVVGWTAGGAAVGGTLGAWFGRDENPKLAHSGRDALILGTVSALALGSAAVFGGGLATLAAWTNEPPRPAPARAMSAA
jgi:hypothetical protein